MDAILKVKQVGCPDHFTACVAVEKMSGHNYRSVLFHEMKTVCPVLIILTMKSASCYLGYDNVSQEPFQLCQPGLIISM